MFTPTTLHPLAARFLILCACLLLAVPAAVAQKRHEKLPNQVAEKTPDSATIYEIWEQEPAPNRGADYNQIQHRGYPYDKDWEYYSYPVGNGYLGASLFGRTDTERVQLTDKTLHVEGPFPKGGGVTNFAELYLDFNHGEFQNYRRSLNLNTAIASVRYDSGGVHYSREYFASYPDKALVIRLAANQSGALSFKIRLQIPYTEAQKPNDRRTAKVLVENDLITASGTMAYFGTHYEGQVKVLNEGGTLVHDAEGITVTKANSVTLLISTGTNYRLGPQVFLNEATKKLDPTLFPHEEVSHIIRRAAQKDYAALKADHLKDYQNLFSRVAVNLNSRPSPLPTSALLAAYQGGEQNTWLEELLFQYGRYLLIASSRETTLPANLQGAWSQYEVTPWSGGYWHNINVQMNYWGAFNANLAETFEAYIAYFKAYLPKAKEQARAMVKQRNPSQVTDENDNGWIIGTGASAYRVGSPGGHSGPGTGGFTSKLLMDYYLFTKDRTFLEEVAYPAMVSLSRFYSSTLVPHGDLLLVEPSASPENLAKPAQVVGKPGKIIGIGHYETIGCTFDQGFVWENFNDTLLLAKELGKEDAFLGTMKAQMKKLDPVLIGTSGQIKEYREENAYSEIGDPKHRHISHLCALYPGTLINTTRPEWVAAASKTLDLRGDRTTGWAIVHRMNCRARLGEGDKARGLLALLISERTTPNLWTLHPPFQIDANLGAMAGVAEMLLQSHEEWIRPLPALPSAWETGEYKGLVARGNFVLDAQWKAGRATTLAVTSRRGGECRLEYPGIGDARVVNARGAAIAVVKATDNRITFNTTAGERYSLSLRPNP